MTETNDVHWSRVADGETGQTIADETRRKARTMLPYEARENLLRKARQFGVAVNLNNLLSTEPKISG